MFWVMLLIWFCPLLPYHYRCVYCFKNKWCRCKDYPPIRVWGTVGFIVALWVSLLRLKHRQTSLCTSAASLFLGLYAFSLPKCPPLLSLKNKSLVDALGLTSFCLKIKMALFFIFAMLLEQLTVNKCLWRYLLHDFQSR